MTTTETRISHFISEPFMPTVRCVTCQNQVPQHQAYKVTVTRHEPFPGYPMSMSTPISHPDALWQYTYNTWDPSLSATASTSFLGPTPSTPTHLQHTYTGFACSQEHAEQGVKTCPAHEAYQEKRVRRAFTW